jgi:hypothetical protein
MYVLSMYVCVKGEKEVDVYMCLCMYVCMHACIYSVCMYVCIEYACMRERRKGGGFRCMHMFSSIHV